MIELSDHHGEAAAIPSQEIGGVRVSVGDMVRINYRHGIIEGEVTLADSFQLNVRVMSSLESLKYVRMEIGVNGKYAGIKSLFRVIITG
jgi:hypothetical protein